MPTLAVKTSEAISWPDEAPTAPAAPILLQPPAPTANAPPMPAPASKAKRRAHVQFRRDESIVVALGSAALGALTGAIVALLAGGEAFFVVQSGLWLVFAAALHLALKTFADLVRARAWKGAAWFALHLFAFAPWPLSVINATPYSGAYWLGFAGLLATLAAFLMSGRATSRIVYRVCAHTLLMSGMTSLQAMMLAFVR